MDNPGLQAQPSGPRWPMDTFQKKIPHRCGISMAYFFRVIQPLRSKPLSGTRNWKK
jgi:hypothetical protein